MIPGPDFGWSLPPGVSDEDIEGEQPETEKQEKEHDE